MFTAKDFLPDHPRGTVDVVLSRLAGDGLIRRIGRGLYEFPRMGSLLDRPMPPDIDLAAQAIARKHRWTVAPDEATAANVLGLSQQVPAKIVYLSDGPSRALKVGNRTIRFRHASPKDLRLPHYSSRLVAQALRYVGKEHADTKVVALLKRRIPLEDRLQFREDVRYGTDWIVELAEKIAGDE